MIKVTAYHTRKVGVFGLGKAGEATIASLLAGGAVVYAADDSAAGMQKAAEKFPEAQVLPISEWPWKEMVKLVLSPGVPLTHPKPHAVVEMAKQAGCPVVGDIELLYRSCPRAKYVGITGTNGKSTTTTLVGHILKSAGLTCEVGGNLGIAALHLNPLEAGGIYVLELSSYQLDLLHSARFDVAAFLNITPDHLDRHGDMEGYVAAKMHIFDRQVKGDVAVVAVDDGYTRDVANQLQAREAQSVVRVSSQVVLQEGVYVKDGMLHDVAAGLRFDLRPIQTLTGAHNWQNAGIAYGVARACGVSPAAIYEAMQSFAGLRHRLQLVATINGVRFINDSKATNADATEKALAPYENIYWIAGGKAKAGGIEPLMPYFPKVAHAFLIGEAEEMFAGTIQGKARYTRCGTLREAVKQAAAMAFTDGREDAVVLLSPACASFDQWKSFEERGDAFCAQVEALAAQEGTRHAS
ncbi:MAG: UDP-N-acetylmuramoyl-L-alanine--D-glutamate ligase [Rickettsiales bacterium]|nr:UDP-N-acetylmuramoyl-L-alanine--D-glutamate ligase [Rickettsiales bacterium]